MQWKKTPPRVRAHGRSMKEYIVPVADVAMPAALAKWIERARAHRAR